MKNKRGHNGPLFFLSTLGILDTLLVLQYNRGINLGTLLPGILGALLLVWALARGFLRRSRPLSQASPLILRVRQVAISMFLMGLISFLLVEGAIIKNAQPDPFVEVDYLIILGAGLNGEQLSWTLWERMQKGLEYLEEHPRAKVILSGGQGFGEKISEAEGMRRFLVDHGIANERILKEEQSTSTMENFRFSKEILAQQPSFQNTSRIAVITSDFHLFRSKILARRNGIIPVGIPSQTPWYLVPNLYLREYFAVVKSLIFDR